MERLMGHGGIYDELGQVSTMLGTGHADQRACGARIDAVRDQIEAVATDYRGAVEDRDKLAAYLRHELGETKDPGMTYNEIAELLDRLPGGRGS